jgi:hypothetical protein
MVVGVALVEIHVHDSQSLKAKRGVVRSIAARLRQRFNCAVAEVGGQGTWQRAVLALSAVGSARAEVRRVLERAVAFVEDLHLAEVVGSDLEILGLPLADAADDGEE